jgi:ribonuclease P protein component
MPDNSPAAARALGRLTRRREFLAAANGGRAHGSLLSMQTCKRPGDGGEPRFGMTATRKTGGAVERNRMRRRLREALRQCGARLGQPGHDYVIVVRRALLDARFDAILNDLEQTFRRIHAAPSGARSGRTRTRHTERAGNAGEP